MISAAHILGGSWACSLRKFLKKKCNLERFDVSLHTILGPPPPRQVPSHAICGPPSGPFISFLAYYMGAPSEQFLRIDYGGPLRSVYSQLLWRSRSLCIFFILLVYVGPRIISLHSILGPPDHFLRLLYGGPQVSFFHTMGAPLRSLSLFTIWAPPPQISFFACYRGPPQILVFSQNIVYGGPLRSVSPLTIWDPLRFVSLLTYGAPSDQFLCLLFGGPLRSVFSLTIWGPLRSVSSPTIWGSLEISFFAYYVRAPPPQISLFAY